MVDALNVKNHYVGHVVQMMSMAYSTVTNAGPLIPVVLTDILSQLFYYQSTISFLVFLSVSIFGELDIYFGQ